MSDRTTPTADGAASAPTSWHAMPIDDVAGALDTDIDRGLTSIDAAKRLDRYGPNRLEEVGKEPWWKALARQFLDPLIGILAVAAVISVGVGDSVDAIVIVAIVVLNGLLGFVQEYRAEKALEALKRMLTPTCIVIRDGTERTVSAESLVPGDVVVLEVGDQVPADLRLGTSLNLRIDESALTGESVPVAKSTEPVPPDAPLAERSDMAFMGTVVVNGRGTGIVVATAMATEFGHIARLSQELGTEETPLQRRLEGLGRRLGALVVVIGVIVFVGGVLAGKPPLEMFLTGVSLAVAAVPEGLPAVVTITLGLGVRNMVRRNALIRRLRSAETLGSADVICTDKTGTLTENEMTVTEIWLPAGPVVVTGTGYDPAGHFEEPGHLAHGNPRHNRRVDYKRRPDLRALLETGLYCNHAALQRDERGWHAIGDPTEVALIVAAYKAWLSPNDRDEPIAEISFNSQRKRMTVVVRHDHGPVVAHIKGAPEVILERCTKILDGDHERAITDEDRARATRAFQELAERGLRTLALARRPLDPDTPMDEAHVENDLTFLGIVGIIDPPRPEVRPAIEVAKGAGIRTIMITGDAAETALAVARRIGLHADRAVIGTDLDGMSDDELAEVVREPVLFARTAPEHKLRIVSALQHQGGVVAMTGDGVNDAPALKQADIGVAMGRRGTDVAKAAADMVLTDDNYATIVAAVEEGRRLYDNIQKFIRYLLSSNTGEVLAIFANILIGGPLILLPVQILWMNLITDGMTAVALGVEPAEPDIMRQPPRDPRAPILSRHAMTQIGLLGSYVGIATLVVFTIYLAGSDLHVTKAHTMAFTGIVIFEKLNVFNFRSLRLPLYRIGFLSNRWLLAAWATTVSLQVLAVYAPPLQRALGTVPLHVNDWLVIFAVGAPIFVITEGVKWWGSRRGRR